MKTVYNIDRPLNFRKNQRNRKAELHTYRTKNLPIREPYYHPPEFRGIRVYTDMDLGYLRMIYVSLWECGKIPSFYVRREKPENLGCRPTLDDGNNDWWLDDRGNKKRYGRVNLDRELCRLMPGVRRFE